MLAGMDYLDPEGKLQGVESKARIIPQDYFLYLQPEHLSQKPNYYLTSQGKM